MQFCRRSSNPERHPSLVIEAPPGAGRLLVCLRRCLNGERRSGCAGTAGLRHGWQHGELRGTGEEAGETVGYQVRFEESVARTRLRFVTRHSDRRLLSDPMLKGVDAVVLDEFMSGTWRATWRWRC